MSNAQVPRYLTLVFIIEVSLGVLLLLITGNWITLLVIAFILGGLATLGLGLARVGMLDQQWFANRDTQVNKQMNSMTVSGVKINLGGSFPMTEPVNLSFEKNESLTAIQVEVQIGTLRVIGQPGLEKIQVTGQKQVSSRDAMAARLELDNLQVTSEQVGGILKIYAGSKERFNFAIGRSNRIDLDVLVPLTLAGTYITQSGDITLRGLEADTIGRSNLGSLIVENFGAGRNLNLTTLSGNITVQQIAAGKVEANTNLGRIELVGIGAEELHLESSAGSVRARGVNCGIYRAKTNAGSVELYNSTCDGPVELRTNLGRVYAAGITAPNFILTTDAGTVYYLGSSPRLNSEARSNLGTVELHFPGGAVFQLEATSNVGTVSLGLPPATVYSQNRNHFNGVFGTGGPLIRAGSNLGTVSVGL